jgi:FdhE protein
MNESLPPAASPEVRESRVRLDRLAVERPELADLVRLYRELLPLLFGRATPVRVPSISPDGISEKVTSGVPILRGAPLEFDDAAARVAWRELCAVVARVRATDTHQSVALGLAAQIDPGAALRKILASGPQAFLADFGSTVPAEAVLTSLRFWALPRLAALAKQSEQYWIKLGWSHGYCPACGSWPILAEFRGLEQFRWLRCGLCGSGWQVDRLFCPFCESRNHRQLQDLFVDGQQEKYRVTTCDVCRGFVRGVSTLTALTASGLLVAELETLHLELIAQERGYSPAPDLGADPSAN